MTSPVPPTSTGQARLVPLAPEHGPEAIAIFNHYVREGFAAFLETPLPEAAFAQLLAMAQGLPALALRAPDGRLAGFGLLRPFHPLPAFAHTAELSCFLGPEHTGRGLGQLLLAELCRRTPAHGIGVLLAEVSSLNPQSLRFHEKHGFVRCGELRGVGRKFGRDFDLVYLQRNL